MLAVGQGLRPTRCAARVHHLAVHRQLIAVRILRLPADGHLRLVVVLLAELVRELRHRGGHEGHQNAALGRGGNIAKGVCSPQRVRMAADEFLGGVARAADGVLFAIKDQHVACAGLVRRPAEGHAQAGHTRGDLVAQVQDGGGGVRPEAALLRRAGAAGAEGPDGIHVLAIGQGLRPAGGRARVDHLAIHGQLIASGILRRPADGHLRLPVARAAQPVRELRHHERAGRQREAPAGRRADVAKGVCGPQRVAVSAVGQDEGVGGEAADGIVLAVDGQHVAVARLIGRPAEGEARTLLARPGLAAQPQRGCGGIGGEASLPKAHPTTDFRSLAVGGDSVAVLTVGQRACPGGGIALVNLYAINLEFVKEALLRCPGDGHLGLSLAPSAELVRDVRHDEGAVPQPERVIGRAADVAGGVRRPQRIPVYTLLQVEGEAVAAEGVVLMVEGQYVVCAGFVGGPSESDALAGFGLNAQFRRGGGDIRGEGAALPRRAGAALADGPDGIPVPAVGQGTRPGGGRARVDDFAVHRQLVGLGVHRRPADGHGRPARVGGAAHPVGELGEGRHRGLLLHGRGLQHIAEDDVGRAVAVDAVLDVIDIRRAPVVAREVELHAVLAFNREAHVRQVAVVDFDLGHPGLQGDDGGLVPAGGKTAAVQDERAVRLDVDDCLCPEAHVAGRDDAAARLRDNDRRGRRGVRVIVRVRLRQQLRPVRHAQVVELHLAPDVHDDARLARLAVHDVHGGQGRAAQVEQGLLLGHLGGLPGIAEGDGRVHGKGAALHLQQAVAQQVEVPAAAVEDDVALARRDVPALQQPQPMAGRSGCRVAGRAEDIRERLVARRQGAGDVHAPALHVHPRAVREPHR